MQISLKLNITIGHYHGHTHTHTNERFVFTLRKRISFALLGHPNTVLSAKNNDVHFGREEFKSEPIAEFTGYNTPPV